MTREQVIEAIGAGRIGAVTIDTTVFDSKSKNFRQPDFRAISQFRQRGTPVVITDVIANEMKAHLEEEAEKSQRELRKALRSNNLRWHREQPADEAASLFLEKVAAEFARSEFEDFVAHVGAQLLPVANIPGGLSELFRRYFLVEAPFSKKDTRKIEFPDAAALLCLEAYAVERERLVLCIAQDKSWVEFAAQSEHLVAVFPLKYALGAFNEAFADQDLADGIVTLWKAGDQDDFENEVFDAIIDRLAYVDFDVDADSPFHYEAEPMEAELLEILMDTLTEPVVLATDDTSVTFSIDLTVKARFNAVFSFAVWDSIDKNYVGMGSESTDTIDEVTLTLTIVAERDISKGIQNREVSVSQRTFTVDFGHVDAFPDEPEDDRY